MVKRMIRKGLYAAPVLLAILFAFGGSEYAVSGAVGLAMTLGNLWLAARIIGVVAEKNPRMLLTAAMLAFTAGLAVIAGISFVLKSTSAIYFPVTGFTLIGSHLVLVLWEGAGAYRIQANPTVQARES